MVIGAGHRVGPNTASDRRHVQVTLMMTVTSNGYRNLTLTKPEGILKGQIKSEFYLIYVSLKEVCLTVI